jgi:DNA-binding SARP family transcriptional activator
VTDVAGQRRSAKRLIELLATNPGHAIHREQIFEILWPKASVDSARNSLAKALHAARHAIEPERIARQHSIYLRARDDLVALDRERVVIDADTFQRLAQAALRVASVSAYEAALASYTGALLPEDVYEDWATERRRYLGDLKVRVLLGLAQTLESEGNPDGAIDCLGSALQDDPTREDIHRRLMHLYQSIGARDLALRQFDICHTQLHTQLNRLPDQETTALYERLLTGADLYPRGQAV